MAELRRRYRRQKQGPKTTPSKKLKSQWMPLVTASFSMMLSMKTTWQWHATTMTTLRRQLLLWTWCLWMKWMKTTSAYHKTIACAASLTSPVPALDSGAHRRTKSSKSLSTRRSIKTQGLTLNATQKLSIISWTWIPNKPASERPGSILQMILNREFHLMINRQSRLE